uniref:Uncharacterized protein n=1 Tax=Rhizophagus irregularis (strain DAOM 181602 / DAOM 197198 / MUCL 43194) TaxID=747089 RepID=U9UBU5_RHIID
MFDLCSKKSLRKCLKYLSNQLSVINLNYSDIEIINILGSFRQQPPTDEPVCSDATRTWHTFVIEPKLRLQITIKYITFDFGVQVSANTCDFGVQVFACTRDYDVQVPEIKTSTRKLVPVITTCNSDVK